MSRTKHRKFVDNFIRGTLDDPDWAISLLLEIKHERQRRELAEAQLAEVRLIKAQIASVYQRIKGDGTPGKK